MNEEREVIYKSLPLELKDQGDTMPHGGARGYGVVYGNWDSYKDVMAPGGCTNPDAFVKDGFMPVGHDWSGLPVGYIVAAKEDGSGLDVQFAYHSIQSAQDARTVAKERKSAGKSVGLSIGFRTIEAKQFDSSASLIGYANSEGIAIQKDTIPDGYEGWCRLVTKYEAFEVSQVNAPANRSAQMMSVKSRSLAGRTLEDHTDEALAACQEWTERMKGLVALKDGRISDLNKERMSEARKWFAAAIETFDHMLAGPAKSADDDAVRMLMVRDLELRHQSLGLTG
jgi:phage head maturation protease